MVIKIAISGKMCSGKSFCAKMIKKKYNQVEVLSFAGKLKEVTHDLFFDKFVNVESLEHTISQMHKNRRLYVDIGQSMREIDPMVWINHVIRDSNDLRFVVVDDLRFKNEMNALQKDGWKIVRLKISRDHQIERLGSIYLNSEEHIDGLTSVTETELDDVLDTDYDFVVEDCDNVGEKVLKWVDDLVKEENGGKGNGENDNCVIVDFESYIRDNGVIC